jgi:hypothetical protein
MIAPKEALRRLSFAAGRFLYEDESPLHHHLKCHAVVGYRRLRSGHRAREKGAFPPETLRERGYVRLEGLYDPALVESIRAKLRACMKDPGHTATRQRPGPDGRQYSLYLKSPAEVLPELSRLLSPPLIASLENHYRAHVDVLKLKVWRNLHVPPEVYTRREIFSNRYHCDHSRAPGLLKMFYLVDDVGPDQGPFRVQPRPRTRELLRRGWRNRDDYVLPPEFVEDPEHVVPFTGPAGSVMIADTTSCLHRASNPAAGHHRDIVQFQLVPSARPLAPDWLSVPRKTYLSPQELGQRAPSGS